MYSSESPTQVLLLVMRLMKIFGTVAYVLYDNACGIVRHLRKQLSNRRQAGLNIDAWELLLLIRWIIDKLHWTYHKSCKDPASSYYVSGVSPHEYPQLVGIDTEAAEQIWWMQYSMQAWRTQGRCC